MCRLLRDVSVRSAEDRVMTSSARSPHMSISVLLKSFANPSFIIQLDSAQCESERVVMPIFAMAQYRMFHDRVSARKQRATEMTRLRFRAGCRKQMTRRTKLRHRRIDREIEEVVEGQGRGWKSEKKLFFTSPRHPLLLALEQRSDHHRPYSSPN